MADRSPEIQIDAISGFLRWVFRKQVIYLVERDDLSLFVGQQLDVFIDAEPETR
jgi:hypothetical protein